MPTDLAVAIARRRAESLFAAQDEKLVLLAPTLLGFITIVLAARSPVLACAVILARLQ